MQSPAEALDQATAQMLASAAAVGKMLMQAEPENELTAELWEACLVMERSVAKVRELKG